MKRTLTVYLLIMAAMLLYALWRGPLFPLAPIKPGFQMYQTERYRIIYPAGDSLPEEYLQIDSLMDRIAAMHGLAFRHPLKIIVTQSSDQYRRFSMAGGRACALPTGRVIYISPTARQAEYAPDIEINEAGMRLQPHSPDEYRDLSGFLKHELSHALLYQNTTLLKALRIPRWIEEGLAVHYGNPDHYFGPAEFRQLALERNYLFNPFDKTPKPHAIPDEIKYFFVYAEYREFVRFLIQLHGVPTLHKFFTDYLQSPSREEDLFRQHFGYDRVTALALFRRYLEKTHIPAMDTNDGLPSQ